jgi:peptide deformylase
MQMETFDSWSQTLVRIVKYPHPTLRYKSKPLRRVDSELKSMVRQMFDLMYANQGVGLSANQVDLPYRLIVMNIKSHASAKEEEYAFINPVIVRRKGKMEEKEEGCLSLPQIFAPVKRPQKIVLNAYNLAGQEVTWDLTGCTPGSCSTSATTWTESCSSTGSVQPISWR